MGVLRNQQIRAVVIASLCLLLAGCERTIVVKQPATLQEIQALAKKGDKEAQTALGNLYFEGVGVPQDDKEGFKWYRRAAEEGDAVGQNNLGACYEHGRGVATNITNAVMWYRKSAEQGCALA